MKATDYWKAQADELLGKKKYPAKGNEPTTPTTNQNQTAGESISTPQKTNQLSQILDNLLEDEEDDDFMGNNNVLDDSVLDVESDFFAVDRKEETTIEEIELVSDVIYKQNAKNSCVPACICCVEKIKNPTNPIDDITLLEEFRSKGGEVFEEGVNAEKFFKFYGYNPIKRRNNLFSSLINAMKNNQVVFISFSLTDNAGHLCLVKKLIIERKQTLQGLRITKIDALIMNPNPNKSEHNYVNIARADKKDTLIPHPDIIDYLIVDMKVPKNKFKTTIRKK